MSINKCALNFLLFLIACFTKDQQISFRNGITFLMLCTVYEMSNIIACNRQQRWPYKILIEKLQELEEKPKFSVTLVFEYFCSFDFITTFI